MAVKPDVSLLLSHVAHIIRPDPAANETCWQANDTLYTASRPMKKIITLGLVTLVAGLLHAADSGTKDKITAATKKVGDQANYSWTTSTKEADGSPGRLGPLDGKAEKGGVTFLSFTIGGLPVEVCMKGSKGAAKALEGWQTFEDIAATGGTAEAVVKYLRTYQGPVAEATGLAGKLTDLKEADGALVGDLKEDALKELLLFGTRQREGQVPPKIEGAKGSVKFSIKDGALTKYEIKIQGKVTAGERVMEINRTTTTEIKEVGSTKIELPDEAKQKLN